MGFERDELKAIIREAVAEELDARLLRKNRLAIETEMRKAEVWASAGFR